MNKFVISFRTHADGTILFSGHTTYRDYIKLEVVGGLLRFSVDAGDKVVSVTSQENVANGNTTSASFGYDESFELLSFSFVLFSHPYQRPKYKAYSNLI